MKSISYNYSTPELIYTTDSADRYPVYIHCNKCGSVSIRARIVCNCRDGYP